MEVIRGHAGIATATIGFAFNYRSDCPSRSSLDAGTLYSTDSLLRAKISARQQDANARVLFLPRFRQIVDDQAWVIQPYFRGNPRSFMSDSGEGTERALPKACDRGASPHQGRALGHSGSSDFLDAVQHQASSRLRASRRDQRKRKTGLTCEAKRNHTPSQDKTGAVSVGLPDHWEQNAISEGEIAAARAVFPSHPAGTALQGAAEAGPSQSVINKETR